MQLVPILLVEDDEHDTLFVERAFKQAGIGNPLQVVRSGDEAMAYLTGTGAFAERGQYPMPGLVLMDVNTSGGRTGLDVLRAIRADATLRPLIVILWTSSAPPDTILEAYRAGVNSFLFKPATMHELAELTKALKSYWLEWNQWNRPGA